MGRGSGHHGRGGDGMGQTFEHPGVLLFHGCGLLPAYIGALTRMPLSPKSGRLARPAIRAQAFRRYPVLNTHQMTMRQAAMKPSVMPRLTPTLTSEMP